MDESISSVIGLVIFASFVAGLAESIGAPPFLLIVALVIFLVSIDTFEVIRKGLRSRNSNRSSNSKQPSR